MTSARIRALGAALLVEAGPSTDFAGPIVGSTCAKDAWALAQRYYAGLVAR